MFNSNVFFLRIRGFFIPNWNTYPSNFWCPASTSIAGHLKERGSPLSGNQLFLSYHFILNRVLLLNFSTHILIVDFFSYRYFRTLSSFLGELWKAWFHSTLILRHLAFSGWYSPYAGRKEASSHYVVLQNLFRQINIFILIKSVYCNINLCQWQWILIIFHSDDEISCISISGTLW